MRSWEAKCGAMMTKCQQQHHQHTLKQYITGQVKGTTWGAMRPPEKTPFGRGAGRRARVQKYKGFAVHGETKMQGVPLTHTKSS